MPQMRDHTGRFTRSAPFLTDGLANLVSGAGTTADKRTHAFYTQPWILPEQIEAAYRSSWFIQKGVDLPAFDMTRNGRDWQLDEADVSKIEREEKRLQVWAKLRQVLIYGRLGGGLIIIGTGGDPTQPLERDTIAEKGLKYLHVMNRWQVTLGEIITDPVDPFFGQPAFFELRTAKGASVKIHPSRVIAFPGKMRPNLRGGSADDWFWGDSVLAAAHDAVKNADAAMNGFASLIDEAKIDTISIPGLIELVGTAAGEQLLLKRVQVANQLKSTHNVRIVSGAPKGGGEGETWETRQVSWAGMPDMIRTYAAAVAGAFDIPATRFLGKSPDGMNATGQGDEANYAAKVRSEQDAYLRPALDRLDIALLPSAGVTLTDEAWYSFPPLAEMTEKEKAEIFKTRMEAITALQNTGTIPEEAFAKAVQHTAVEEGWLDGLDGALAEVPLSERFLGLEGRDEPDAELDEESEPIRVAANDGKKRWLGQEDLPENG
jgi:uncharacterized protein